jgi:hypothetical protein
LRIKERKSNRGWSHWIHKNDQLKPGLSFIQV